MISTLSAPARKVKPSSRKFQLTDTPTPVPCSTARRLVRSAKEVCVVVKANSIGQELLVAVTRTQAMQALKLRPRLDEVLVSTVFGALCIG